MCIVWMIHTAIVYGMYATCMLSWWVNKWVNDHNIYSEKVKQTGEYTRNLMVEGKGSNNSWEVWI